MQNKQIILASASPRRKELLELMGLTFQVIPSKKEEVISGSTPAEIVENLSYQKAEDVAQQAADGAVVIGSDTVVVCGGEVMGKPHSEEEAFAMLHSLQGRSHEVYTGVTVISKEKNKIAHDTFSKMAVVKVHEMSDEEIWTYIAKGESMDKAGAYGIQGSFAVFVDEIQGEYNTVLGLPIAGLYQSLKQFMGGMTEAPSPAQHTSKPEGKMKKAVVFDLDGTLSDSIVSIAYCANRALEKYGLQSFPTQRYKYFVGDGAAELIRRTLKNQDTDRTDLYEAVKAEYDKLFAVDCMYQVRPYDGIPELLRELKKRQVRVSVLSNKPHPNTCKVIHDLFGDEIFDVIQGQVPEINKKPSPDGVFMISEKLGIPTEEMLYVGDTNTDMKTGKSAGAFTVGVLWGFRERAELEENHADAIIAHPLELLDYL